MSIVLFTGAGASKPFGYPITTEFFQGLSTDKTDQNYVSIFRELVGKFESKIIQQLDVEHVLSLLDKIETFLDTDEGGFLRGIVTSDSVIHTIPKLIEFLRRRVFSVYGKTLNEDEIQRIKTTYCPLIDYFLDRNDRIDWFTTNYDLVPENLMEIYQQKIEVYDGFERSKWDKSGYAKGAVKLAAYKLHGSLTWMDVNGQIVRNVVAVKTDKKHFIIYPGFKREIENHSDEIFRFNHEEFRQKLSNSRAIIVIGFSFRDDSINKVIKEVFQSSDNSAKVVYLGPTLPKKLKELIPDDRCVYLEGIFENYNLVNFLESVGF